MRRRDFFKHSIGAGMLAAVYLGMSLLITLLVSGTVIAETPLKRRAYLVHGIAGWGNCHTPRDPDEKPIAAMELAGGRVLDLSFAVIVMPNITPDTETGIGTWTDDQIATAIREGKRPDGILIGPAMPVGVYRGISDSDARAIVAYLRSVPPVSHKLAKTTYKVPVPTSTARPLVVCLMFQNRIESHTGDISRVRLVIAFFVIHPRFKDVLMPAEPV